MQNEPKSAEIAAQITALETRSSALVAEIAKANDELSQARENLVVGVPSALEAATTATSRATALNQAATELERRIAIAQTRLEQAQAEETRAKNLVELARLKEELAAQNQRLNELGLSGAKYLAAILEQFEQGMETTHRLFYEMRHLAQQASLTPFEQKELGHYGSWGLGHLATHLDENGADLDIARRRVFVDAARLFFDLKQAEFQASRMMLEGHKKSAAEIQAEMNQEAQFTASAVYRSLR